jgi:UDP-N-acetylglucosamine 3-dehydrogenase
MLKVGILGAGFMGSTHARAFAAAGPGVRVVGISSRSFDKAAGLAAELGAEPFTDALALARDPRLDAVSVTLPANLHLAYAVAALKAGKHVLVEKPMGLSVGECDAMIEAAERSGRLLMVAHVLRFWPEYVALVEFVKSGALGAPLAATASRLCGRSTGGSWSDNPEWTGGAVLDLHIHDLDTLNWLFGQPVTVYARGQRGISGGWDHVLTVVDYGNVCCQAEASMLMPTGYPFTMNLSALCERGSAEFAFRAGGGQVDSRDSAQTSLVIFESGCAPRPLATQGGDGYLSEIAHFVKCIQRGMAIPAGQGSPTQARLAVRTALAARESIETGQVVRL